MKWPDVLDEVQTLDAVLSGRSIARFGDGEFGLVSGADCITQKYHPEIELALRMILAAPGDCLVGIPRQGVGPKQEFWSRFDRPAIRRFLTASGYVSSLVTRPDSAPWIDAPLFWWKLGGLWRYKTVTLVRGSGKSLTRDLLLLTAERVIEVIAPLVDAFAHYDDIMTQIGTPKHTVLLCIGPTATIMAHDLCQRGVHAVDLGHVGMFLRKHLHGQPMKVTDEDKDWDRRARDEMAR